MSRPARATNPAPGPRAALLLLACLLCALPAFGQSQEPLRVHVLHLASNMAHAYDAVKLTKALEQKVIATKGVTFLNRNKMLIEVLGKAKCGDAFLKSLDTDAPLTEDADRSVNEACEARLAAPLGAPFKPSESYVWGFVYEGPDKQLRATVHLWRRGQTGRKMTLPYEPDAAEHVAGRLARHLFESGRVGDVKLSTAAPVQGELYANDEPAGRWGPSTQELTLPTGLTRFEVREGGKVVARGQGEVRASARAVVALEAVVEPPPVTAVPPAQRFSPIEMGLTTGSAPMKREASALPWVFGGVGALGLVGAGVFLALRQGANSDLEKVCRSGTCTRPQQDTLDRGNLYGTLSLGSLGVGLVGAGLATYFALDAASSRSTVSAGPRWVATVQPLAGGGAASLSGRF
jgi:hypothetical protein